jgi:hypothetical protein
LQLQSFQLLGKRGVRILDAPHNFVERGARNMRELVLLELLNGKAPVFYVILLPSLLFPGPTANLMG